MKAIEVICNAAAEKPDRISSKLLKAVAERLRDKKVRDVTS